MTHALVTGATGFIGTHLAQCLAQEGWQVSCLVRSSSKTEPLEKLGARLVLGDVTDRESVVSAVKDVDVVFHLAGLTKSLHVSTLHAVNGDGVRSVVEACATRSNPPTLVLASSLAAAGPSWPDRDRVETDPIAPISEYGRSKRDGELAAIEYADRVPASILRPPIVLGQGDKDGFAMYEGIVKTGVHAVPGRKDHRFSIIHADDLASAMLVAASTAKRVTTDPNSPEGVYFAAADEVVTYAELGRMLGAALGVKKVRILRIPLPLLWTVSAANQGISRLRRRAHILNLDKAREAAAGSWSCSNEKLKAETGFQPAMPFADRLKETVAWYRKEGWLKNQ